MRHDHNGPQVFDTEGFLPPLLPHSHITHIYIYQSNASLDTPDFASRPARLAMPWTAGPPDPAETAARHDGVVRPVHAPGVAGAGRCAVVAG